MQEATQKLDLDSFLQMARNEEEVKVLRFIIPKLKPFVALMQDGSARYVDLSDGSISVSNLYHLLNFFFRNLALPAPTGGGGSGEKEIFYPIDAQNFLSIIQQAKIPAKYLKMHLLKKINDRRQL